jgi:hypothetical protein
MAGVRDAGGLHPLLSKQIEYELDLSVFTHVPFIRHVCAFDE